MSSDTLGGRILRAREIAGYSEIEFACSLGITRETVVAWESDRSEPRANRLVIMAGLLGVSPGWLLHELGEAPPEQPAAAELAALRLQISKVRELRDQTGAVITNLEKLLESIEKRGKKH